MAQNIHRLDDRLMWQTNCRAEVQKTLLELYAYVKNNRAMLEATTWKRSACGLLIGSAFSLWRATFLADASREWGDVWDHAEQFLEHVVGDNATNYTLDRENRAWTVGFYLNNARFRLCNLYQRFPQFAEIQELDEISQYCTGGIGNEATKKLWHLLYDALWSALDVLKRAR